MPQIVFAESEHFVYLLHRVDLRGRPKNSCTPRFQGVCETAGLVPWPVIRLGPFALKHHASALATTVG